MPCSCGESTCPCSERCICRAEFCLCISCLCIRENEIPKTKSETIPLESSQIIPRTSRQSDFPERKRTVSSSEGGREYKVLTGAYSGFGKDIDPIILDNTELEDKRHSFQPNAVLKAISSSESDCEIICEKIGSSSNRERHTKQEDNVKRNYDDISSVPNVPEEDGSLFHPTGASYSQRKRRKRSCRKRKSVTNDTKEFKNETNILQPQQRHHLTFQQHGDFTVSANTEMQTDRCSSNVSIPAPQESSFAKFACPSKLKSVPNLIEYDKQKGDSNSFNFSGRFRRDTPSLKVYDFEETEIPSKPTVLSYLKSNSILPRSSLGSDASTGCTNSIHSPDERHIHRNYPDITSVQNAEFTVSDNNMNINQCSSMLSMSYSEPPEFRVGCEAVHEKTKRFRRRRPRKGIRKNEEAGLTNVQQISTTALSQPRRRRGRRRKRVHIESKNNIKKEKGFIKKEIKREGGFIKKEIKQEKGFIKKEIKKEKGFIKKEIKKERY